MHTLLRFIMFSITLSITPVWAATPKNACAGFLNTAAAGSASQKLKKLIDFSWKYSLKEFPEFATYAGSSEGNDRWTDNSAEAAARREKETLCKLQALKKISRAKLKGADLVNYELLLNRTQLEADGMPFDSEYLVMDHMSGLQTDVADTLLSMPAANRKDVENMIKRLEKTPVLVQQTLYWLREGAKRKVTPVKMFMAKVPAQFDKVLTTKIEDSPIYKPFADLAPGNIGGEEIAALQKRAREVIQWTVNPALAELRDYLVKEYIPAARESTSWKDMPNGPAWYALNVKSYTTTSMTPEELHDLGLKEVARIGTEMTKIRERLKFRGDAQEFNKFLLSDKKFYFNDKEALLSAYRDIAKRIDPELPRLFKTLPRLTYGVRPMPDYKEKDSPTAYYMGGSLENARAGYFEANTYDLKARPKWGMEALTMHEAVPGHHLQIAIAQEIKNVPEFRKFGGYTAFIEGWGLYAESLGEEMGFYKDPYSKYGQLTYEMWRAVRLVVDTGIHQYGWPRQKAIDYMMAQMPKTQLESEIEIDRYITWPGQALAYKVGQLKFKELRERAQTKLGEKFDVREFHDELLNNGALPLDVLGKMIDDWINLRLKEKA